MACKLNLAFKDIKAFFFDLDNTLHDYSKSAGKAMDEVYQKVHSTYGIPIEDLKQRYVQIMSEAEKNAFFDGRTSKEYRTERFSKLLSAFNITDDILIGNLLSIYSATAVLSASKSME